LVAFSRRFQAAKVPRRCCGGDCPKVVWPRSCRSSERRRIMVETINTEATRWYAARRAGTMSDQIYEGPAEWKQRALIKESDYRAMYERSLKDPNGFWTDQAKRIHWY